MVDQPPKPPRYVFGESPEWAPSPRRSDFFFYAVGAILFLVGLIIQSSINPWPRATWAGRAIFVFGGLSCVSGIGVFGFVSVRRMGDTMRGRWRSRCE